MIDLAVGNFQPEIQGYYVGGASLYTGFFFLFEMKKNGGISVIQKIKLREENLQTFLLSFEQGNFWSTGDDNNINFITV